MFRLLIDQNLDHDILRGLFRRIDHFDAVTAREIGMAEASDTELLIWAAKQGRVTITHDRTTMPTHAGDLMRNGAHIAGLFVVPRRLPLRQVLEDLELLITCTDDNEWIDVIRYLPL